MPNQRTIDFRDVNVGQKFRFAASSKTFVKEPDKKHPLGLVGCYRQEGAKRIGELHIYADKRAKRNGNEPIPCIV